MCSAAMARAAARGDEAEQDHRGRQAVADAGAFCMVVEGVMEDIATDIAQTVDAPVIGIGASAECDGQVLVTEDMLGMFERTPRFVKRYDDLAARIGEAARTYAEEVRARASRRPIRPTGRKSLNRLCLWLAASR